MYAAWNEHKKDIEKQANLLRVSGRNPLLRGKINFYAVFAELGRSLINDRGRMGMVLPTGIASDDTNRHFFADLVEKGQLASLFDFENREGIFPAVHRSYKFCLFTIRGANGERRMANGKGTEKKGRSPLAIRHSPMEFVFFATRTEHLRDKTRRFTLSPEDFRRINPNTRTCPIFRTRQDAELARYIYENVPVLVNEAEDENHWGISFKQGLFNMTSDSHLFRTREELEKDGFVLVGNRFVKGRIANGELRMEKVQAPLAARNSQFADVYLPLYEAKMIWHFDHRFGTYEGVRSRSSTHLPIPTPDQYADPSFVIRPWYWVNQRDVEERLGNWKQNWLLGFRDVTNVTNERTAIFSLLPRAGVGHTMPLIFPKDVPCVPLVACLLANLDSLVFDFVARQKVGGTHLTYNYLTQLPVLPPSAYTEKDLLFIVPRVLELVYTAWDMKPFADDVWREAANSEWGMANGSDSPFAVRYSPLQEAILRQWEENRRETGGNSFDLPEWAAAYPEITPADPSILEATSGKRVASSNHSPFAIRHSPTCPFPPFKWDEDRRARIRAELDVYYAKLYGLTRKQLRYILDPADLTERELEDILDPWEEVQDPLDPEGYAERMSKSTFPGEAFRVLKEKELRLYGEYRTRRLVLEAWEEF